jgi:hypothetical protein
MGFDFLVRPADVTQTVGAYLTIKYFGIWYEPDAVTRPKNTAEVFSIVVVEKSRVPRPRSFGQLATD